MHQMSTDPTTERTLHPLRKLTVYAFQFIYSISFAQHYFVIRFYLLPAVFHVIESDASGVW